MRRGWVLIFSLARSGRRGCDQTLTTRSVVATNTRRTAAWARERCTSFAGAPLGSIPIGERQRAPGPGGGAVAIGAGLMGLILACPSDDHAPLRQDRRELDGLRPEGDDADVLVCTFCGTVYPIRDGIPMLLADDATPGPNGIGVALGPTSAA